MSASINCEQSLLSRSRKRNNSIASGHRSIGCSKHGRSFVDHKYLQHMTWNVIWTSSPQPLFKHTYNHSESRETKPDRLEAGRPTEQPRSSCRIISFTTVFPHPLSEGWHPLVGSRPAPCRLEVSSTGTLGEVAPRGHVSICHVLHVFRSRAISLYLQVLLRTTDPVNLDASDVPWSGMWLDFNLWRKHRFH